MNTIEIEKRLFVVMDKLKAGVPHEMIIRCGMAEWDYSRHVMRHFIGFAYRRLEHKARHIRQRNAMVSAWLSVRARKELSHG